MRPVRVLGALLLAAFFAAPSATAKEGVRAELLRAVDLGARPGETIRVAWRLVDDEERPFGAGGIYLRVFRCSGRPLRIPAKERGAGRYSARVKVPKRGIRKLDVGLKGWRIIGDRSQRADAFFAFDPPLSRRCS